MRVGFKKAGRKFMSSIRKQKGDVMTWKGWNMSKLDVSDENFGLCLVGQNFIRAFTKNGLVALWKRLKDIMKVFMFTPESPLRGSHEGFGHVKLCRRNRLTYIIHGCGSLRRMCRNWATFFYRRARLLLLRAGSGANCVVIEDSIAFWECTTEIVES